VSKIGSPIKIVFFCIFKEYSNKISPQAQIEFKLSVFDIARKLGEFLIHGCQKNKFALPISYSNKHLINYGHYGQLSTN
jgi:hypothetical protein